MINEKRRKALQKEIEKRGLQGALLVSPENIYYLTGAPFLAGRPDKLLYFDCNCNGSLIVNDLDYEETCAFAEGVEIVKTNRGERSTERLKMIAGKTLGIEENFLSLSLYEILGKDFELKPLEGVVDKMREIKDSDEVERIESSQRATERALNKASGTFKGGMTELEIASEIEYNMRREGAVSYAYDSIVASGARAVYPHGNPTNKKVGEGEGVVIDIGSRVNGYCSDMTRTLFFGKPNKEMEKVYQSVLESQESAIEAARNGITGKDLDGVARESLSKSGYSEYFVHGLGHGVGIAVHEGPTVNSQGKEALVPGNVITIEPGVYIPNIGAVRIEDMLLIDGNGSRNLTKFTKELLVF